MTSAACVRRELIRMYVRVLCKLRLILLVQTVVFETRSQMENEENRAFPSARDCSAEQNKQALKLVSEESI